MSVSKFKILYVDDDKDMLDSLRIVLEANNYEVKTAMTAEEGIKVFKRERPNVVIVDLMMEEVDSGTNFVKNLRLIDSSTPVYMLSSVGDKLNAEIAYSDLGLSGIFQKPLEPKKLLTTLKLKLS